ncbi:PQQ-dependent sugar dehydrogenase [Novosphingobium humi]|uniref:PQQ-dependent sugar dehydrogenase n=1 Tax=Novosphingobium humi TaxID=2282397 RepID=A0ABY7U2P8_9SPHN|nr:PQQ-dependent sugar dehydrogenase [Novosphingobium humi]WCT79768.1 PQQ-dependent sugar dehydrogenase [Novosphingobium humi]
MSTFPKSALCALALSIAAAPAGAADGPEVGVPARLPGAGPFLFQTAEQSRIKVDIIAGGLVHGYSLAFLPNGDALVVERGARLRMLRNATGPRPTLAPNPIAGIPEYSHTPHLDLSDVLGIQDVALDPDFAVNHLIYLTINRPVGLDAAGGRITAATVLARGRLDGMRLVNLSDLVVGEAKVAVGGSRILPGRHGDLFVSVGALSEGDIQSAQRTDTIYGKVLRVMRDGRIPSDNPFVGVKGARSEIWTFGHRDPLGLAFAPQTGQVIASEHGPQGGDELNILLAGRNYGWPNATYGTQYGGSPLPVAPVPPGTQGPTLIWSPSIAPAGIAFYTGAKLRGWRNNLFIASARRGQINGTGALIRVVFNERLEEVRQEVLLGSLHQRLKDVRQGPDGLLYALTDEPHSVVLRIAPAAR